MSEDLDDKDSKTEQPSERKLEESIEKGQISYSREVTSFAMLLSLAIVSSFILPYSAQKIGFSLKLLIEHAGVMEPNQIGFGKLMMQYFNYAILFFTPVFIFFIIMIILSSFLQQGRFIIAPEVLMPSLSRISLQSGLKRMFSGKSLMEFAKGLVKIIITGTIIYYIVISDIKALSLYSTMSEAGIIKELGKIVNDILVSICVLMFAVAFADFFYQKYEYIKNLMMTRHEVKEEYKQAEGSPEVKSRQRKLMSDVARKRMMANVPKADVIITNPEHYSIALEYKQGLMPAPIIIAKGMDLVALKIREIAKENDIPIVENPPLARALYLVGLGNLVPTEHYEAVAEVIGYVYKMKNKKFT
ncbi:MAG: flagellar biosynthesis protein FlhB [Rickettsiaceae bacterium]|nr:flagellar biosynthesis protein FlhB [Rickettsiaceae bacterium]